jgi:hypothetical protein
MKLRDAALAYRKSGGTQASASTPTRETPFAVV